VTAQPILEALAKEFSTDVPSIQATFEMLDAGLTAPFIGRFRRSRTGAMSEVHVRKLGRRREELQELDRRRGTILRAMAHSDEISPKAQAEVEACMDRFDLEDLYVPHRRPEPEVQLALDRGLGALADILVAPVPKAARPPKDDTRSSDGKDTAPVDDAVSETASSESGATETPAAETPAAEAQEGTEPTEPEPTEPEPIEIAPDETASIKIEPDADTPPVVGHDVSMSDSSGDTADKPAGDAAEESTAESTPDSTPEVAAGSESSAEPDSGPSSEPVADPAPSAETSPVPSTSAAETAPETAPEAAPETPTPAPKPAKKPAAQPKPTPKPTPQPEALVVTAELSKLCQPFVNPDKGVHTETEALAGAIRILSDRLGRDARLRGHVRRIMRKKGVLRARAIVDEKKAGRHKNVLKAKAPLRQLQGHRLTAIRQAQAERVVNTTIELDPKEVIGRVRASLGKHTRPELEPLLMDIAEKALQQRIMPVVEADVRLELKERSDAEALRFLGSHLRQVLLTPFFGRVPVCGVDVSAKGDLALAFLDAHGALRAEARIEVGDKEPADLAKEIAALCTEHGAEALAVGSGKSARAAGHRIREAMRAAALDAPVMVVNDAGASSYANGARAREELAEASVPTRLAITTGRRLQDPMAEFLKVDPKQLGLGSESRLVSKANLRRVLQEAVESALAFVGCDFDTVPRSVIEHLPGLDAESGKKLADRRDAGDIESREAIRDEGVLTEAQWTSVAAFLRMRRSSEPLDRTSLHPEQYQLARQLLETTGGSVSETLGRPGSTKGLRRQTFGVDEYTWRDLMRELSFPGRDPRGRNHVPTYVSDDTDSIRLQPGRVLEGVVTNVASFGAFVDIGRKQDAMIHISELASRYIRDARELLSVGATIRARIVDGSSSRMALSLKDVATPDRAERGDRRGGGARGGARGGGRGDGAAGRRRGGRGRGRGDSAPTGPAGRIWRRDGAAGAATSSRRGTRRGGPRRGGREDRGERVDLNKLNAQMETPANNPFAKFFDPSESAPKDVTPPTESPKAPESPQSTESPPLTGAPPPTEAAPQKDTPADAPAAGEGPKTDDTPAS